MYIAQRKSSLRRSKSLSIGIASTMMLLSACSTNPSQRQKDDATLVMVACPELTALTDRSFGATVRKLDAVANQYWECRAAALGQPAPQEAKDDKQSKR